MPFGLKPECVQCKSTESSIWRKTKDGTVCISCFSEESRNSPTPSVEVKMEVTAPESEKPVFTTIPTRKSARLKPQRGKTHFKTISTKGKNRRIIFKRNTMKAPTSVASIVSSRHVFHDGIYWQAGDIASVMDFDGGIYYVQIRGFLQDQFCEKSAVLTWLLPTTASPPDKFDPSTYIIGPEEELPRSMNCLEFVCHAPSDYYKNRTTPYPLQEEWRSRPELCCVYTRLGPQIMSSQEVKESMATPPREKHLTPSIPPVGVKTKQASEETTGSVKQEPDGGVRGDKKGKKTKGKKQGRRKKTNTKPEGNKQDIDMKVDQESVTNTTEVKAEPVDN